MPLNKPLDSITEQDLRALIGNEADREGKAIDYKETGPKDTPESKKEFLNDVSSFANAAGGHLVIGMLEEDGLASELTGIRNVNADTEIQRLENLARDNIKPRIPGLAMRAVPLASGGVAIVVHVPRSWAQPHVVDYQKHWRFYSRNSAGKYPLDVSELRAAFAMSETIAERIRGFRVERLGKIVAGETPIKLEGNARLVLHLVPLGSVDPSIQYNVSSLPKRLQYHDLAPMTSAPYNLYSYSSRHNFDGFLTFNASHMAAVTPSHLQIFRNGNVEAVDTSVLEQRDGDKYIYPEFERLVLDSVPRFLKIQKELGATPPIFVMLSLLGVSGYRMWVPPHSRDRHLLSYPIDRNDLILPEIMIEGYEFKAAQVLRPAFDAVWNAAGWPCSQNYNEKGEWVV